jgi:hypothetical protein
MFIAWNVDNIDYLPGNITVSHESQCYIYTSSSKKLHFAVYSMIFQLT